MALRQRIVETIYSCLQEDQAGLLSGMLIGYRDGLSRKVQENFSDAGLTHIMAVSGANIAFVLLPFMFLFKRLRLGVIASNTTMLGVLVLFVYITGFSPSVMRAVIMAGIVLVGRMLYRETEIITGIAAASVFLLFYNPYLLFDIGFQLSFGATLSLVLFCGTLRDKLSLLRLPGFVADMAAVTLAAQLGVLPITLYHFNKITLLSLCTNLIVIPLVQLITLTGFAMVLAGQVSIPFAQLLGYANHSFLSFILAVTQGASSLPYAVITVPTPTPGMLAAYYLLLVYWLYIRPKQLLQQVQKYYPALVSAALLAAFIPLLLPQSLIVCFLDVGQGDAIFIRTGSGRTALIDGGGFSSRTGRDRTMGDTVVLPFLYDQGVTRLDAVLCTHGHDDHLQGLLSVLQKMPADRIFLPENPGRDEYRSLLGVAASRGIPVTYAGAGDRVRLDRNTLLSVLHPQKNFFISESPLNNESIVLKLHYGKIRMLFTGDVEAVAETLLLDKGEDLRADVLKVAHHGSAGSSGQRFLDAVKPLAAVITVGSNNFGHPSPNVLDRLAAINTQVWRTDRDGAVIVTTNGKNIIVNAMIKHDDKR